MSKVGSNTVEGIACALWCGGAAGQVPVVEGKELPLPDALRSLRLAVLAELRQTAARLGLPPLTVGHLLAEYETEHCHG